MTPPRFLWVIPLPSPHMGLVYLLALGAALFVLSASLGTAWFLTHPPRRTLAWALVKSQPADPSQLASPRPFREWTLNSRGLSLRIWDIPGDAPDGPAVILTHGWGDSRIGALPRLNTAARFASRVVAWDLAGHGESDGVCMLGTQEAVDLLMLIDQLPAGDVVLWGWSLGAGVGLAAAAQRGTRRITAIICESSYRHARTPAANVLAARELPWHINLPIALWSLGTVFGAGPCWHHFDRREIASALAGQVPVLMLHGAMDIVCPLSDAQSICDAANAELAVIATAGHNDLWSNATHARQCDAYISEFMRRVSNVAGA